MQKLNCPTLAPWSPTKLWGAAVAVCFAAIVVLAITCSRGSDIPSTFNQRGGSKSASIGKERQHQPKPWRLPGGTSRAYAAQAETRPGFQMYRIDAGSPPQDLSMVSIEFKVDGTWDDIILSSSPEREWRWPVVGLDHRDGSDAAILTLLVPRGEEQRLMAQPVDVEGTAIGPGFDLMLNSTAMLGTFWGVEPSQRIQFLYSYGGAEVGLRLGQNALPIGDGARYWVYGEERHLRVGVFEAPHEGMYAFSPRDADGWYVLEGGTLNGVEGKFQLDLASSQRVGICPYAVSPCVPSILVTEE